MDRSEDGTAPKRTRLSATERRETILRAAAEVFAQAGYRAAKVSEVAARVGVTEPVIFQNFGSKAALFAARAEAATQAGEARTEAGRRARERDDAIETARRADAEAVRARQAEADARAEAERIRGEAARERDALREQHQAQLEAERANRRHLTTALTAPGNGKLPRAAQKAGQP